MWRWENALLNEFSNWSLKMLLLMCYHQTFMLLLATGISKQQRKERGVEKQLGSTWIKLNNQVHVFVVESQGHCQMIEFRDLHCSCRDCQCSWTVLGTKYVLHHVEEEEKVFHLCQHSKKPLVCLVHCYIKFIFHLACLVITLF